MIKSPLNAKSDLPTYTILIDGTAIKDTYLVLSISVTKAINSINEAKVVLLDGDTTTGTFEASESDDFVPGKKIEISLGYHSTNETVFKGIITAQSIKVRSRVNQLVSQLTLQCMDEAVKLTVGRKSKYFKDKKDSEIISSILTEAGITKKVDATTFAYKKMVQYDCTDWDFIVSRADVNGFIAICNDGTLEVTAPVLSGTADLAVTYGIDIIDFAADLDAQYQIDSVSSTAWDGTMLQVTTGTSAEPSVNAHGNITGKKLSEVLGSKVYTLQSAVPEDASVLKGWANAKLQQMRLAKIQGYVTFPGNAAPKLGKLLQLNSFGTRFNGDAFISGVHHTLEEGTWVTRVNFGLEPAFFTETKKILAPAAAGALPAAPGLQIGTVKQIDQDTDGEYRILVDLPMVEATGIGIWARLSHPYATDGAGFYFLPEVSDEVVLGFLNEDPRFPVIIGSLYGKKKKPPYTPESKNNTKGFVSKSKLKLTFDEEKKSITLETPGGNKVILDDDGKSLTIQDQNKNKITLSADGIVFDSAKDVKFTAKGNFSIDAIDLVANAKGDVNLAGNNINAKAKLALLAQGTAQATLKASGQVEVKGGMVMIN
ncbi:type VI secretion system tip protein VgrG [Parachryseolinea silvisoli]|jgi:Rhs element Vgr protein|uniref:type VI secretion system tip protein VgrG n=1 Tax=Parachryseolinea silvisoli TaxID=2873601 RepID=UPI002265D2C1|nr:type VI secretion system tip protein VgrG [Parachryseolinea silvisoli]MCD9019678.1 type VI secretion system tip protein VgrG [Parachryseolinea silvisoli]